MSGYIRNTHCACLIFDITSRKSFDNVDFWFENMAEYCSNVTQIQTVLIANKSDLQEQRQISSTEMKEKADKLGIRHVIEVSAKTGLNVVELFQGIVKRLPPITAEPSYVIHFFSCTHFAFMLVRCVQRPCLTWTTLST